VPAELTWSCYSPAHSQAEGYRPCGVCDTCQLRIEAFKENNVIDPVDYAIDIDWGEAKPWALSTSQ